jgi:hypothetical protein
MAQRSSPAHYLAFPVKAWCAAAAANQQTVVVTTLLMVGGDGDG